MDIEQSERKHLMERLNPWFHFEEEVKVYSPFFNKYFRVDVLGMPRQEFTNIALAFEVKKKEYWKTANFASACKQASDYVYCIVKEGMFTNSVINSAYIFLPEDGAKFKEGEEQQIHGVRMLAAKHRVGTLRTVHENTDYWKATLSMGNDIWYSNDVGFNIHAKGVLTGKRPIGGSKMNWETICKNIRANNNI